MSIGSSLGPLGRMISRMRAAAPSGCIGPVLAVRAYHAPMHAVRSTLAVVIACILVTGCATTDQPPTLAPSPTTAATPSPTPPPSVPPTSSPTSSPTPRAIEPTLAQLIGQKLVIRIAGTTATPALLGRIQRGEIGGVILFGSNIKTPAALRTLTASLQAAAAKGRQPPLLISVDQEGGAIQRVPWAPPTLTPTEMGADGRPAVAREQGEATGRALHDLGINVDLAPVADVPSGPGSFMERAGRTFGMSSATVASLADAFATGLEDGGVVPSMKHFPGIGFATENTDDVAVTIGVPLADLDAGLEPYQTAISHRIPLVMLSNATYTALDPAAAAGWSRTIGQTLLRDQMGFAGVTITDSLDGTAKSRGLPSAELASRAAVAGTDLVLVTGSEQTTAALYLRLLKEATDGSIDRGTLLASYDRIMALKASLATP